MLNNTGHLLIFLVMVLSLTIIYKSYLELKISSQKISNSIYQLSLFQSTFAISSFLVLIVAFINSDFSLINVYENSHSAKPLFYKIAGAWVPRSSCSTAATPAPVAATTWWSSAPVPRTARSCAARIC